MISRIKNKILKSSALLQKIRRKRNYLRLLYNDTPVFIFQMGKVASSSIYYSIKNRYSGACIHAHSFSTDHSNFEVSTLYKAYKKNDIPIKLISMVREPISRNISAFFENFERDTGYVYEKNPYSIEELQRVFLEKYNHNIPLNWFDEHIKTHFSIDVYAKNFPETGHAIFKKRNVELLLFKYDLNDEEKEQIISEFIGLPNFKLISRNVGALKNYSNTYKVFKKLPLPEYYIDGMLNSKYFNHFYQKDKKRIKEKWI